MKYRISARDRGLKTLGILASILLSALILACSGSSAGFRWNGMDGSSLAFSFRGASREQLPATFGKAHAKDIFTLKKAYLVPVGSSLEVRVRSKTGGGVLSLGWTGKERKEPEFARFSLAPGLTSFYLRLGKATEVRALSILLESSSGELPVEVFVIESVSFTPEFVGYAREADGVRISDGISIQKSDRGYATWTLAASPAAGDGKSASATGGVKKLRTLSISYGKIPDSELAARIPDGISLRLGKAQGPRMIHLPLAGIPEFAKARQISVTVPDSAGLDSISIQAIDEEEARLVDPGILLLSSSLPEEGDFAWYRWDLLPGVLMFDFKSYEIQDRYLKRLAFFVEKKGFVGRLASDSELQPLHGWNAHDYKAEDLARYFTQATRTGFELNPEEKALGDFLVAKKVLLRSGKEFKPGEGAIISISKESPDYLRRMFLTHEASHAIFFLDEKYREFCTSLWESMDEGEKWFWKLYFGWMNYNTSSSYLMANEMQGYLVQQGITQTREYFTKVLGERILENHDELIGPITEYMAKYGMSFEARARQLDAWLKSRYGFGAGRMYFIR
jgi:hypothetical protein